MLRRRYVSPYGIVRAQPTRHAVSFQRPQVLTMDAESQRPKRREGRISSLNAAIDAMNIAKDVMDIAPAKAVFASVSVVLTLIKVQSLLLSIRRLLAHVHRKPWSTKWTMLTSG